jgi:hypothetical protein
MDHTEYINFLPTVDVKVLKDTIVDKLRALEELGLLLPLIIKKVSFLQVNVFTDLNI